MEVENVAESADPKGRFWGKFYGPNMGYVEEQYELYKDNPEVVDPTLKEMFDSHGAPEWTDHETTSTASTGNGNGFSKEDVRKITAANKCIDAIRRFGHLEADIYPDGKKNEESNLLNPERYGITEEDLKDIPAHWLWNDAPSNIETGHDFVKFLRERYTGTISFEYDHVNTEEERNWIRDHIEHGDYKLQFSDEDKKQLLERLIHVERFETFLQKTFVGQKRFSIEGLESMVAILDQIVKDANKDKIENLMMGLAHRGRLSVLAYVLGKPMDRIFSEFQYAPDKELMPSEGSMGINYGWTGDVKYHFGATRTVKNDESSTHIRLAN